MEMARGMVESSGGANSFEVASGRYALVYYQTRVA